MIYESEFPILNFDDNKTAKIANPIRKTWKSPSIKYGVICFDTQAREEFAQKHPSRVIGTVKDCGIAPFNIYAVKYNDTEIVLHQGIAGSPWAASMMEDLAAFGCESVIAVGGAGALKSEIARGHLIIPTSAVRQEGTSYHYAAPSKYIEYSPEIINKMCEYLKEKNLPFVCGRTWTTDAVFRETQDLIELRKKEGCLCVEMENAAFGAVAQFYNIKFGQILYGGDSLCGDVWNERNWANEDVNRKAQSELLILAMEMVTRI